MARDNFIPRIFASLKDGEIFVDEVESNYVSVLKLDNADKVELVINFCEFYSAEFVKISNKKFTFTNLQKLEVNENFDYNIDLLFGVCAKDNLRDILDFGTQVGVVNFYPFDFEFSHTKNSLAFLEKKGELIIKEAVRQCRTTVVPKLHPVLKNLEKLDKNFASVIVADLSDEEKKPLAKPQKNQSILVVIGPESGLSNNDLNLLSQKFPNKSILTVSPIVMRSQIAVVGVINYIRGALQ